RIKVMNEEETDSPTITTIDMTLIETDLEVEIIETEIIIIETEAALEIDIIVMIEMTTALAVETDLLLGDLATKPTHHTIGIIYLDPNHSLNIGPLAADQGLKFRHLLEKFADIFATDINELGRTNLVSH
ncbi:14889_t:CDS:2, partial [Gigaspora rosea]